MDALIPVPLRRAECHGPKRAQGFVLVVTLVIMVIITLASVAMMTMLRAGISASGNIAFRQAATRTADVAIDKALQDTAATITLSATAVNDNIGTATYRYYATVNGAVSDCTKDGTTTFQPQTYRFNDSSNNAVNDTGGFPCAIKLASAPSGYNLFYVVHRMAENTGACGAGTSGCTRLSVDGGNKPGCSNDASSIDYCGVTSYVYYRLTVKVAGPRQNNRYVQAFVY